MTAIVEVNDLELSVHRGTERLYSAPAVALVEADSVLFGEPAWRLARMHPQRTNQQYLKRLNDEPLPVPSRGAANHADLVYLHMKELAAQLDDDVILAVPGTHNPSQLGVLLGICQEAGLSISGFVNAAVAATAGTPLPERFCYLDVYLQHLEVSTLSADTEVRFEQAVEVRECGATALLDSWVNLIADRFVQETRFDPLHTAESEQQLYDQVYDWAMGPHQRPEVGFEVLAGEQRRRVEIPRSELEQKAGQRIRRLLDVLPGSGTLAISARTARLPGFSGELRAAGYDLCPLTADAVAAGCRAHLPRIRSAGDDLRLVTRLPYAFDPKPAAATERDATSERSPTHLLEGHIARPLAASQLARNLRLNGAEVWVRASDDLWLNGEPTTEEVPLRLGDVIESPAGTFTAIRLEP